MNASTKQLLKYSPLGIGILALMNRTHFHLTKDEQFENKLRLVFPHYNQSSGEEGMSVKIVSENQLEHVIKMCNIYRKSVKSLNDHAISAYKGINILLDYTVFDQIKRVNIPDSKCKTEPGITLVKLNHQLRPFDFYVPYIAPTLNENPSEI